MHPITESVLVLAAVNYFAQSLRAKPTGLRDVVELVAILIVVVVGSLHGFLIFGRWAYPYVASFF